MQNYTDCARMEFAVQQTLDELLSLLMSCNIPCYWIEHTVYLKYSIVQRKTVPGQIVDLFHRPMPS